MTPVGLRAKRPSSRACRFFHRRLALFVTNCGHYVEDSMLDLDYQEKLQVRVFHTTISDLQGLLLAL